VGKMNSSPQYFLMENNMKKINGHRMVMEFLKTKTNIEYFVENVFRENIENYLYTIIIIRKQIPEVWAIKKFSDVGANNIIYYSLTEEFIQEIYNILNNACNNKNIVRL
jgi:hypothetical protein